MEERPPAEPLEREKLVDEYFHKTIEDNVLIQRDVLVDLYKGIEKVLKFAEGLLYTGAKNAGKLMSKRGLWSRVYLIATTWPTLR